MVIARPPQPELPVNIHDIDRQLQMINVEQSGIRTRMRGIEATKRSMGDVGAEQTDIHSVNYYEDQLNILRDNLKSLDGRETALQDRRTELMNVSSLARQEAEETAVSGRLSPFFLNNTNNTNNGSSLGGLESNGFNEGVFNEMNVGGGKKKSKRKRSKSKSKTRKVKKGKGKTFKKKQRKIKRKTKRKGKSKK
jgi:hypothetical protein